MTRSVLVHHFDRDSASHRMAAQFAQDHIPVRQRRRDNPHIATIALGSEQIDQVHGVEAVAEKRGNDEFKVWRQGQKVGQLRICDGNRLGKTLVPFGNPSRRQINDKAPDRRRHGPPDTTARAKTCKLDWNKAAKPQTRCLYTNSFSSDSQSILCRVVPCIPMKFLEPNGVWSGDRGVSGR